MAMIEDLDGKTMDELKQRQKELLAQLNKGTVPADQLVGPIARVNAYISGAQQRALETAQSRRKGGLLGLLGL